MWMPRQAYSFRYVAAAFACGRTPRVLITRVGQKLDDYDAGSLASITYKKRGIPTSL